MWLAFKSFTIASSSAIQPLVFTTTSAAILGGAIFDPIDPGSGNPIGPVRAVAVADTSPFQAGDKVYLDIGASAEKLVIQGGTGNVITSATSLNLRPTKNHASGAFVTFCYQCDNITLTAPATNTGIIYLFAWNRAFTVLDSYGRGSLSPTVSAGAPGTGWPLYLAQVAPGGQLNFSNIFGAPGPLAPEFIFCCGTANDVYSVVVSSP